MNFPTYGTLMVCVESMREADNENDELTFVKLAAVTANVVRWLMQVDENRKEDTGEDSKPSNQDERRDTEHEKYVATRCREIRAWEKRARGLKK
jgi:hypothetical protein